MFSLNTVVINVKYLHYKIYLICVVVIVSSCSLKRITKIKDVTFDQTHQLQLDVYAPKKSKESAKVLIFVHGGNWVRGKKSIYKFFGKRLAKKGIVGVIINYRLSPTAEIKGMTEDAAMAVKWVKENSASFNGDTNHIFISGHSAGAHIAALVATDQSYFKKLQFKNPIRGVALIDAFGLNMYNYLKDSSTVKNAMYHPIFGKDSTHWKNMSPNYHLTKNTVPFLMLVGGKTYPIIKQLNTEFYEDIKKYKPETKLIIIKHLNHIPMMFQFYNSHVKSYHYIIDFMNKT